MAAPRKAPLKQAADRDSVAQAAAYKAEADSANKVHMAVARNKAKARLAAGQDNRLAARGLQKLNNFNPFDKLAKLFGGK